MVARALALVSVILARAAAQEEALPLPLSAGAFNVTAASLKAALKAAPHGALLLGFSSPDCAFCRASEPQYAAYAALADAPVPLARVNAEREKGLAARYDATILPALVLVRERGGLHQLYKGEHDARAIAAFVASRVGPPVRALARGLGAVDEALAAPRNEQTVLLIGFFAAGDDAEDDEADLEELARGLRAARPDAAVFAAKAVVSAAELGVVAKERKWVRRAPSVAVWLGADAHPRAATPLDEAPAGGLSLAQWSARASLPRVGWLTEDNFGLYAATELPMLILFVDPAAADLAAYRAALASAAVELEARAVFVLCDGIRFSFKKITLGLADGALPAMALNTRDEAARYPYEGSLALPGFERAVRKFVTDFSAGRLRPKRPEDVAAGAATPPVAGPRALPNGGSYTPATPQLEHVTNLTAASLAEDVLGDNRHDVLLLLYSSAQCGATCLEQDLYFARAADRLAALGIESMRACRLDLARHALPPSMPVALQALPMVLALPAADKRPPFKLFEGELKPRRLLYFAQRHATHRFELPENPHLTREQNELWHEQINELEDERRQKALDSLRPDMFY